VKTRRVVPVSVVNAFIKDSLRPEVASMTEAQVHAWADAWKKRMEDAAVEDDGHWSRGGTA
jgi:hypothetical protein